VLRAMTGTIDSNVCDAPGCMFDHVRARRGSLHGKVQQPKSTAERQLFSVLS
jgi:hypothetical protein